MTPISPMAKGSTTPVSDDPYFYGWRYVERKREDGTVFSEQIPLTEWDVLHPQEDDFIMTNALHLDTCFYLKTIFEWWLADQPGALVHCDHRIDWQVDEILPHGPDISVFFDSPPKAPQRATYYMHDMGARPVCVIEVTSPATRSGDFGAKVTEYCVAGIPIYVIIDLLEEDGAPDIHLYAYRPTPNGPEEILSEDASRVWIPEVDLWIAVESDHIVCLDPQGNPIGDYADVARSREEEKREKEAALKQVEIEKREKETALKEKEVAFKRAEIEKREKEAALKRAEIEKREKETALKEKEVAFKRAEIEKREKEAALKQAEDDKRDKEFALKKAQNEKRADDEKRRADESHRKLQEMEAELRRLRGETR